MTTMMCVHGAELEKAGSVRGWRIAELAGWWHVVFLAPVLPLEVLLLTLRFDAQLLAEQTGVWAWLLAHSSQFLRVILASATAAVLFSGAWLLREGSRIVRNHRSTSPWWLYFAAHLASVLAFTSVTQRLFEEELLLTSGGAWGAVWCILGLATFGFWLATLVPPMACVRLIRAARWPLAGAAAVGFAAWGFGAAMLDLWRPLAEATFELVALLLAFTGATVVTDPRELGIGTSTFGVSISPECSGYEGIGLILVFLAVYLWLFRRQLRFPQILLLVPAGIALIWISNAIRIAALILIGSAGAESIALGGFHSQAGWLAFNALALGFVAVTTRFEFFRKPGEAMGSARQLTLDPTVAYLAPWLAIIAISMISAAFTTGFDWFYPIRVLLVTAVLWLCRGAYGRWDGSWSLQAVALGTVVFGAWLILAPAELRISSGAPAEWAEAAPGWAFLWLVCRVLGYVLIVPLAEELAFRGYLTRRLVSRGFEQIAPGQMTWLALTISSVLFGLLHGSCWPAGIVAGFLFALAYRRRGRLADAVIAHGTTNALLTAYALGTGAWSLWN